MKAFLLKSILFVLLFVIFGCTYRYYLGFHGPSIQLYPEEHEGVIQDKECLECHDPKNDPEDSPTSHPHFTGCIKCHNDEIKSCNDFMKRGFAAQFGERLKFLSPQQATGYFGIFTTAHRAVVPHFRFKKDLILYLNSSRAASSGEFKFKTI